MDIPVNLVDSAEEIKAKVLRDQQRVVDIFNNFFGEDYVDFQPRDFNEIFLERLRVYHINYPDHPIDEMPPSVFTAECDPRYFISDIIVHFPEVKVTNEHGNSIVVKHLYIKTCIDGVGRSYGVFTMTRSEFTEAEMKAGYIHSHCRRIPAPGTFEHCCLGTGPIQRTITRLAVDFDEDLWNLYCFELSEYVKVESIAGTPYYYLEKVAAYQTPTQEITPAYNLALSMLYPYKAFMDFLKDYLPNHPLPLNYIEGVYSIAMPPIQFYQEISKAFIEWDSIKHDGATQRGMPQTILHGEYVNGVFIARSLNSNNSRNNSRDFNEGCKVCTFKGVEVHRVITKNEDSEKCLQSMLDPRIINYLATRLLFYLNYGTTKDAETNKECRIL